MPPTRHDPVAPYQPPRAWSAEPEQAKGVTGYAPCQQPEPLPGTPRPERPIRRPGRDPGAPRPTRDARTAGRGGTAPPAPPSRRSGRRRRPGRGRRIRRILLVLLLLAVITPVGLLFYYDAKLHRVDALAAYPGRPADTPGTNWLIVGTDSRAGLSDQQRDDLSAGDAEGARTDTIMLVQRQSGGRTIMVSIPRDLYVDIPGQGQHKINSAFNNGGPQLLVQTVEQLTGIRIDHYAEIGFGGFDELVDAVGGVRMCLDRPLRDPLAGLDLPAGCQELDGREALGLVRTRAFPNADLERVVNQRKFLSALMHKATSPAVILNPFRLFPMVNGAVSALTVDESDHIWDLARLAWSLHGDPITSTVPTDGEVYTGDGSSLSVGADTEEFFDYLRRGQPVPEHLLSDDGGAVG